MPTPLPRALASTLGLLFAFGACAGAVRTRALPLAMPHDATLRRSSLSQLGQRLFDGLRRGALDTSLATPRELETLILPEQRFRLERERVASFERAGSMAAFQRDWAAASYAGFCAQGAREEPARRGLGLTQPGWVLERILVVSRTGPGTLRSASWLEGNFVYTEEGWKMLSLRRVEPPRHHHSDLELAPCDVEEGLR